MKTMIRSLSMALMLMVSLAGVTPVAFATTKFGVQFDFTFDGGGDAGGAFLSFDVDPDNLPFDQWINFDTVTGFKMDAWVTTPDRNATTFTEQDLARDIFTGNLDSRVYIENLNPIFPVKFDSTKDPDGDIFDIFFFEYLYGGDVSQPRQLRLVQIGTQHGTGSGYFTTATAGFGTWTVTAAWFDDPIPVTSVPEPAAFWLFGAGVLVLAAKARRRQAA